MEPNFPIPSAQFMAVVAGAVEGMCSNPAVLGQYAGVADIQTIVNHAIQGVEQAISQNGCHIVLDDEH
jgi:hypothetical protein